MSLYDMNDRFPRFSMSKPSELPSPPASHGSSSTSSPPPSTSLLRRSTAVSRHSSAIFELASFSPDILEKLAYRSRSRRPGARLLRFLVGGRRRASRRSPSPKRNQPRRRPQKSTPQPGRASSPASVPLPESLRPGVASPSPSSPQIVVTPPTPEATSPVSPISPETPISYPALIAELPAPAPLFELASPDAFPPSCASLCVPPSELPAAALAVELHASVSSGTARGSWHTEREATALRQAKTYKQHSSILEEHLVNVWVRAEKAEAALEASESERAAQSDEVARLKALLAAEREKHARREREAETRTDELNAALQSLKASTLDVQMATQRLHVKMHQLAAQNRELRERAAAARAIFYGPSPVVSSVKPPSSSFSAPCARPGTADSSSRTLFSPSGAERVRKPHGPHQPTPRRRLPSPPLDVQRVLATSEAIPENLHRFEWDSAPVLHLNDPRRAWR